MPPPDAPCDMLCLGARADRVLIGACDPICDHLICSGVVGGDGAHRPAAPAVQGIFILFYSWLGLEFSHFSPSTSRRLHRPMHGVCCDLLGAHVHVHRVSNRLQYDAPPPPPIHVVQARGYSYGMVVCAAAVVGVIDKAMAVSFGWNGGTDKPTLVAMLALQGAVAAVSSVTLRVRQLRHFLGTISHSFLTFLSHATLPRAPRDACPCLLDAECCLQSGVVCPLRAFFSKKIQVLVLELVSEEERGNTNGILSTWA